MSYEKQVWKDGTTDYTPLTPERLNHMEDGIAAANDAWDSVAPTTVVNDNALNVQEVGSLVVVTYMSQVGDIAPRESKLLYRGLPITASGRTAAAPAMVQTDSDIRAIAQLSADGRLELINKSDRAAVNPWVFFNLVYVSI